MAATGGGKIRSRRYHIASKPYAKSKQQTGLISRVTDTVKSIVPSWLQKYFKNGDSSEGGESLDGSDQNCQVPPLPPNSSEEAPSPLDGRNSPEPSTSTTEPSTSRASLNFQDYVLSRPPLSRTHLHLTPLDTSSPTFGGSSNLFSQPSTSSAPGPFSTGFSLVKEIKDNLSQHEDDNISTTSGFSSRASDKDVPTSKTASLPLLWSPEMERTNSGPQPSQSSLKKPSFNLSVFGTSSNSTLNSTVLNSSQLGDSPFYPGKTTYGGAAAVRSSRSRPGTPYQAPVRRQIKAKPAGAQPCGVTSATARRILQSLERMSSPLADARRIPAASSNLSPSMDVMNMDMSNDQAKRKRMDLALPPVKKLVVPATASVSGNRSVSFKPTLTPGGFRTLSRSTREKTPTRQSPQLPEENPGPSQSTRSLGGPVYPLSSTPAPPSVSSGGGKMKRERTTARPSKRTEDDEVTEEPKLPAISLPIAASSLPTFSFSTPLPPPTTSTSVTSSPEIIAVTPAKEMATNKDPPKALTPPCVPFTFSSPIVKATAASPPSYSSSPGFTFSAPVAKLGPSMSNGNLSAPIAAAVKPVTSNKMEDFDGPFKPAKTLKQGSVLDLLKSPAFASSVASVSPSTITTSQQESPQSTASPSTTTASSSSSSSTGFSNLFKAPEGWSCDVCLVQNKQSDSKCVCCLAPKPNLSSKPTDSNPSPAASVGVENSSISAASSTTTTTGFGSMFSKPAGTWDCDTCLVVNKPDAVKCVACETAKPGTGLKPSLTFPSAFTTVKTPPASTTPVSTGASGLGDKFKKPEGAWECDTCLVQNKAEDIKCVACTAAKPGASAGPSSSSSSSSAPLFGLADKFKQPEGSWECDVCCVQNKAADVKCVACQAVKPGANVEAKAFGSSLGTLSGATSGSSTSGSSTFGGFKFGTSDSTSGSASASFKFGTLPSSTSSPSGGFKFGVQLGNSSSETSSKEADGSSGFKFGSSSGGFKFGTSSSDDKKSDQPASEPAFKFGVSSGAMFGSAAASTESSAPKGGFTFGLSKPKDETSESASATPPSSSQDKVSIPASSNHTTTENVTTTSATTTKKSVFERLGESNLATNTSKTPPTFGSLQAGKEPAAPTFAFGKPEEKKEPNASAAPPNFVFGGASKEKETPAAAAPSGGFSFGKPGGSTEQPPPPYSFGKSAEKSENPTSEAPKPTFNFGQNAADSAAPPPKQAFSFIASNPNSTTSSTPTPAPSLFSAAAGNSTSTTSAPSAPPSTFLFGQPSTTTTSDAAPAKPFVFGNSQEQPAASSGAPVNSAPAQPFIFGAAANPAAPPAASASSFGFGTTAPSAASTSAPSAAPSPFAFSSAPSSGFGENQTLTFGSTFGTPFPATPSQPPAFGAKPNATPVFGQQTNSTSVFGTSVNAAPSGGFQFGGASAFGSTNNSTPGVFTFGAGAAASPAPPANSSMAPQSGAAGGGFNFSQTPAFNIGVAKFSSPSPAVTPAIAGRKIKTAVRRRK
ncbi:nuclear pore complex protein Nup153 [Oryzias melastigma]|uniref:Nuclear pore complex protein Nup153 n=1 Tax=Oryzias melastigma TaxID=30732 RepID=A0A3B3BZH3_ORYME|nr:nuclear pore complex protein Nup153 [Oryzias melastigma]